MRALSKKRAPGGLRTTLRVLVLGWFVWRRVELVGGDPKSPKHRTLRNSTQDSFDWRLSVRLKNKRPRVRKAQTQGQVWAGKDDEDARRDEDTRRREINTRNKIVDVLTTWKRINGRRGSYVRVHAESTNEAEKVVLVAQLRSTPTSEGDRLCTGSACAADTVCTSCTLTRREGVRSGTRGETTVQ